VPVLEQNQRLEISPRANQFGEHYNGYLSAATWNLTNANASVEVVQVAAGSADTQMALGIDAFNYCVIEQESGRLYFAQVVGGNGTPTSIVYSATQHRFWRIRHDLATDSLVFETSPDRTNWTAQRTVARQWPITALKVALTAGTFQPVAGPGTAIFDDFRIEANGSIPVSNQPPVARPGGPYSGTAGLAVALNGSSSSDPDGTISGYQWSYGDGGNGTGATPSHTYAAAGTYTVTLTVTDNRGATASATTTVSVTASPSPPPATNQAPVAAPGGPYAGTAALAVAFNGGGSFDPDGSITAYQWSFGDGSTGSGVAPTHAYAAAGSYTVTLTVTDDRGTTRSATTSATITTGGTTGSTSGRYVPPSGR
jgi:PKD repeat protein